MGTDLTSTLTEDEQNLLEELKATQTRLDGEIEDHTQVLEDATVKRQRLTSLMEDNLVVRRGEPTESGGGLRSRPTSRRSSAGGTKTSSASQSPWRTARPAAKNAPLRMTPTRGSRGGDCDSCGCGCRSRDNHSRDRWGPQMVGYQPFAVAQQFSIFSCLLLAP